MAILQLISSNQVNEPYQFLGDVIHIHEDDAPISPEELARFDWLYIKGTAEVVKTRLVELDVQYADAFYNDTSEQWQFADPMQNEQQIKKVWTPGGNPLRWYTVVAPFTWKWNVSTLTAEEKQALADIDITNPSVESYARKIMKDLAVANPANYVEEVDLRNQTP